MSNNPAETADTADILMQLSSSASGRPIVASDDSGEWSDFDSNDGDEEPERENDVVSSDASDDMLDVFVASSKKEELNDASGEEKGVDDGVPFLSQNDKKPVAE